MAIAPEHFNYLRNLAATRSGVLLEPRAAYLAEGRLLPLAQEKGMASVMELIEELERAADNGIHQAAVEALLPSDTAFFRDMHPFLALRTQIFKTLEMKRGGERRLAIWCAGCASGQEAYSVAMLIHFYFPEFLKWDLHLIATDLSQEALNRAKEGRYNDIETHRGLPAMLLRQYLRQDGRNYLIKEDVARLVQFEELNLVGEWPSLPALDVVLLRNVVGHFAPESRKTVLAKVGQLLKQDGFLLLGARETTIDVDAPFNLVPAENAYFFQPCPKPADQ
ncbi:MAG: protein-glutamate O-methyltransferase CheR [Verrucomicrobia bacterium]|nr:protein-glutamate O-methyltransferase CheR [Verrucomicrobiota bacterium]